MTWVSWIAPGDDNSTEYHIESSQYIEKNYFPYWKGKMEAKYGEGHELITIENCVEDFKVIHWAEEFSIDRLVDFMERNKAEGTFVYINGKLLNH